MNCSHYMFRNDCQFCSYRKAAGRQEPIMEELTNLRKQVAELMKLTAQERIEAEQPLKAGEEK